MKYILILFIWSIPIIGYAQNGASLGLLAKNTKQGVKLKIIPSQMDVWLMGARNGYIIERQNLSNGQTTIITQSPLLPATESEWYLVENGKSYYQFHRNAIKKAQPDLSDLSLSEKIAQWEKINDGYSFYFLITTRISDFSKLSGLEFLDKKAQLNEQYLYTIRIHNYDGIIGHLHHSFSSESPKSPELTIGSKDRMADISWPFNKDNIQVSFDLEKSLDQQNFEPINQAPIYYNEQASEQDNNGFFQPGIIHRIDSLENNYTDYFYRLVAIDVWGEKCTPSDTVVARGSDLTPPSPIEQLKVLNNDSSKNITLQWQINLSEPLKGYMVYHSHKNQGPYHPLHEGLLPPTTNEFVHDSLHPMEDQYYKIVSVDTAGNLGFSRSVYGYINDSEPPEAPHFITGKSDSSGIITLRWDSVKDIGLKGYMVYGSNSPEKGFVNLTPMHISKHQFVDTSHLNRLHSNR